MIANILKGAAMGIAEVIPGVSGGTIAFITGIYEKLINSIKAFNPSLIATWRSGGFKAVWTAIQGNFLMMLGMGMVAGFVLGVFGVTHLLEQYPAPVWGFFFGLILASCIYVAKQIDHWDVSKIIALIIGAVVAYGITVLTPAEGSTHPLMLFVAGMIAISALILPGISGSFMLLLMGMYTIVLPAIKNVLKDQDMASLQIVLIFAAGCLVGITGFSRVLSWLLDKYRYITFAVLTGFMLGSLNKIWPWRNISEVLIKDTGAKMMITDASQLSRLPEDGYKILSENNVLPALYQSAEPYVLATIIAAIVGFAAVLLLDKFSGHE